MSDADRADALERDRQRIGDGGRSDPDDMADDLGADGAEQLTRDRADRDARRRLARAGALEHVAHVVVAVLHEPGEVGVAGARTRHRRPVGA